jgi:hypothetical protein
MILRLCRGSVRIDLLFRNREAKVPRLAPPARFAPPASSVPELGWYRLYLAGDDIESGSGQDTGDQGKLAGIVEGKHRDFQAVGLPGLHLSLYGRFGGQPPQHPQMFGDLFLGEVLKVAILKPGKMLAYELLLRLRTQRTEPGQRRFHRQVKNKPIGCVPIGLSSLKRER